MQKLQHLESWEQIFTKRSTLPRSSLILTMDINEIADHMTDKLVIGVEVEYDNNTLVLTLDDGSTIELVVDSIFAEIQPYDS